MLFAALVFAIPTCAQTSPVRVSEPQYLAIDSRDNVYVALKYGIIKITPDGTLTNLTKEAGRKPTGEATKSAGMLRTARSG